MQRDEFLPRLARMQREAVERQWLQPRVRYGYFPANRDGNDLVIFSPDEAEREIARFTFPRQPRRDRLCLADYYLPLSSGRRDVAVFQIATVGAEATALTERLQAAGEYSESFFTHGLSVQTAEGLADYAHARIRAELAPDPIRAKRYSWGYPSCPDLAQHAIVDRLIDAGAAGIRITEDSSSTLSRRPRRWSSSTPTRAISHWRYQAAGRRAVGLPAWLGCDWGGGNRFFGQLDRGEKLLDIHEVLVERLSHGLPGDLEHSLTRNDGSALDIFDTAIGVSVRYGGSHPKSRLPRTSSATGSGRSESGATSETPSRSPISCSAAAKHSEASPSKPS